MRIQVSKRAETRQEQKAARRIYLFEGDTNIGVGNENGKDEDNEAYMPAHLSELLVRDGVPKQAPGPQSF